MLDPQKIDELASALNRLVPNSLRDASDDFKANFRAVAQSWFDRLDLVTREEFDAQQAVLARTREKLDLIEQQLSESES